jgi:cytoskeletal protein CcmA (bactofilin family)
LSAPWTSPQFESSAFNPNTEPGRPLLSVSGNKPVAHPAGANPGQATVGANLVINGEITGSEPIFIDCKFEGSITLPADRVTVGPNGRVEATISAREIVAMGKVRGRLTASHRVEIHATGSVTGDVFADSISIEDGAFFKGAIHIRKPEIKLEAQTAPKSETLRLAQA